MALDVAEILKGKLKFLGASLAQGHTHFLMGHDDGPW